MPAITATATISANSAASAQHDARNPGPRGPLVPRRRPRRLGTPAAEPEGAERAEVVSQRVRVPPEHLDRLECAQRGVELSGVAVERVECEPNGLLVVALVGDREVFDPRQRRGGASGRWPDVGAHGDSMRIQRITEISWGNSGRRSRLALDGVIRTQRHDDADPPAADEADAVGAEVERLVGAGECVRVLGSQAQHPPERGGTSSSRASESLRSRAPMAPAQSTGRRLSGSTRLSDQNSSPW